MCRLYFILFLWICGAWFVLITSCYFQEEEIYSYYQLHFALWRMPNWSNRLEGHFLWIKIMLASILFFICTFLKPGTHHSLISGFLMILTDSFVFVMYRRLWNMLKLQAMSTFKNTDDSNYGKQSHVVPFYHSELF